MNLIFWKIIESKTLNSIMAIILFTHFYLKYQLLDSKILSSILQNEFIFQVDGEGVNSKFNVLWSKPSYF